MDFLDKLSNSFGTGALASGAGSLLGGIAGIAGIRQSKKNAKLQRELARKNFQLQKEYAEKNYQLQVDQQAMQREQFNTMVDLSDPLTQRKALENAGFNPFMDGSAIGTPNTPGSSAGSIGQVNPPQYDTSSLNSAAVLEQQSINNAVSNMGSLLASAEKLFTLGGSVEAENIKNASASIIQDALNHIAKNSKESSNLDLAVKRIQLRTLPAEKEAALQKIASEIKVLDSNAVYIDHKTKEVKVNTDYLKSLKQKTIVEIGKVFQEREGIKLDNEAKRIINKYLEERQQLEIAELEAKITNYYASANKLKAETALTNTQNFWAQMPRDYDMALYANYHGKKTNTSLQDALYTSRLLENDDLAAMAELKRAQAIHNYGDVAFDAFDYLNPLKDEDDIIEEQLDKVDSKGKKTKMSKSTRRAVKKSLKTRLRRR